MEARNIKNFIHLYLGCECMIRYFYSNEFIKGKITMQLLLELFHYGGFAYNPEEIKPILRPLSDMTEEECKKVDIRCHGDCVTRTLWRTDDLLYLLSKHFDLFGLIEAGLAINKTTLK